MMGTFGLGVGAGRTKTRDAVIDGILIAWGGAACADQRRADDRPGGAGQIVILCIDLSRSRTRRPAQRNSGA